MRQMARRGTGFGSARKNCCFLAQINRPRARDVIEKEKITGSAASTNLGKMDQKRSPHAPHDEFESSGGSEGY